jgi:tRNA 2-thiouridine synthesizing protein A
MAEHFLDAGGLICPLPVLKARKFIQNLPHGDILHVRVTDPAAPEDFQLFCQETGHLFCESVERDGAFEVTVEIRADNAPP